MDCFQIYNYNLSIRFYFLLTLNYEALLLNTKFIMGTNIIAYLNTINSYTINTRTPIFTNTIKLGK